jgi:hypothetical protein
MMGFVLSVVWAAFLCCGLLFCDLIIPAWQGSPIAQVGCAAGIIGMVAFGLLMDKLEVVSNA